MYLSTSDCLVTLMHNSSGNRRTLQIVREREVSISEAMDLNFFIFLFSLSRCYDSVFEPDVFVCVCVHVSSTDI